MNYYTLRAEAIMEKLDQLAKCSDSPGIISRTFGTPSFIEAQNLIVQWMEQAGIKTRIDNIGNVRGRLESKHLNAKTFVIASHFDTVINAGKFDGPLGVVMAIDLVETIADVSADLPFNIEVIAFSDEEGVRFHSTFLGSRLVAGKFDTKLLDKKDTSGQTLADILSDLKYNPENFVEDAIRPEEWLGYFEIHIEQGPVLYESGDAVAVVTGIAGQKRVMISLKGMAGHAGTVPMNMRQDALCCAAEIILEVEKYGREHNNELVATVGKLDVENAATNVIPGKVNFSLDIRSADSDTVTYASDILEKIAVSIAAKRNIEIKWEVVQETKPVICDQVLSDLLITSMTSTGNKPLRLVSGAGHDGVMVSEVAPIAMLFVRCYKGISHNPLENVEIKDIAAAVQVGETFIKLLAETFKN